MTMFGPGSWIDFPAFCLFSCQACTPRMGCLAVYKTSLREPWGRAFFMARPPS